MSRSFSGFRVTLDRSKEIKKALDRLSLSNVLVGFPTESGSHADNSKKGAVTNAYLGYIHDKGAPGANIPARPFLEPGILDAQKDILADMEEGALKTLDGDTKAAETALEKAGMHAELSVKEQFTDNNWPRLKHDRYRKGKKAQKKEDATPLVDTGQLRRAVTHVVRKKG